MHYLDTSVLTAYYCAEARSDRVQRFLASAGEPTVSSLVEVEFHCAVARKVRAGAMSRAAALRVFSEFELHLNEPRYRMVPIQEAHFVLARDWIARLVSPLRVLDAIHLAVVFSNNLMLVTADKALAKSAKQFDVQHKLIP